MDIDEAPAKLVTHTWRCNDADMTRRARVDARSEDKARGKRLFGNILGTLNKFKKEDKTNRNSEAVRHGIYTFSLLYAALRFATDQLGKKERTAFREDI